jgi:Zn-dependent protease/predicted transcriptional regulator
MVPATRGFKVGRIAGVEVRVDWSVLIVFWLILVNLGGGLFPAHHPDWTPAMSWGVAAIAALMFFLSILAHELSHALVGRANGVPIAGITPFIFGGMAHMRGEPRSPRAELLMTVVGPLTSLVIGGVALWWGAHLAARAFVNVDPTDPLRAFQEVGPLATVLLWLGPINLMLGIFNLVPAFPLDGGRVLRAALWAGTRDLSKATRWASAVGQTFAMLLIFAGVSMVLGIRVPWLGRGLVPGLWTAFIGWFLYRAAAASYSRVLLTDVLDGVPVSRLMRRDPVTVYPELSVATVVDQYFMGSADRAFPVIEGDRLVGIVTLEDVRNVRREDWAKTRISDVMTQAPRLIVATPEEMANSALEKLGQRDIQQLPVVDANGTLLGVVERRDILRWLELQPGNANARLRERRA